MKVTMRLIFNISVEQVNKLGTMLRNVKDEIVLLFAQLFVKNVKFHIIILYNIAYWRKRISVIYYVAQKAVRQDKRNWERWLPETKRHYHSTFLGQGVEIPIF